MSEEAIHPLFSDSDPQDPTRNYHQGDLNSNAAFASLKESGVLHSQREEVFRVILEAGARGVTAEEVEDALDGKHQSVTARVVDLVKEGRIHRLPKDKRRRTRAKRWAWVNVAGPDPNAVSGQLDEGPARQALERAESEGVQLRAWRKLGQNILKGIKLGSLRGRDAEALRLAILRELGRADTSRGDAL